MTTSLGTATVCCGVYGSLMGFKLQLWGPSHLKNRCIKNEHEERQSHTSWAKLRNRTLSEGRQTRGYVLVQSPLCKVPRHTKLICGATTSQERLAWKEE